MDTTAEEDEITGLVYQDPNAKVDPITVKPPITNTKEAHMTMNQVNPIGQNFALLNPTISNYPMGTDGYH